MRLLRQTIAALGTIGALGCATKPIPISVYGDTAAIPRLAGNWAGTYTVSESSRTGTISFSLRSSDTAAFGEVLMLPRGYEDHRVWNEPEHHRTSPATHPSILTISFVGIWADGVNGMLDPYTDPEWNCLVVTTFTGRLTSAETLEGTFVTRVPGTTTMRVGRWSVRRARESGAAR
jgi:hypothetical protein